MKASCPRTREHLAIPDLLGVTNGVIALTKTDAAEDEEWLELVELDIVELLEGTQLADAPVVRVSAQRGEGLEALRAALAMTLADLAPRRNRARPSSHRSHLQSQRLRHDRDRHPE